MLDAAVKLNTCSWKGLACILASFGHSENLENAIWDKHHSQTEVIVDIHVKRRLCRVGKRSMFSPMDIITVSLQQPYALTTSLRITEQGLVMWTF